jgi:predicted Co/Zn/Cd cation transporter (cation efflux family)
MRDEISLLRISIVTTITLAVADIGLGVWANSHAVIFDGMYALVDGAISLVALFVARLIALSRRSQPLKGRLAGRFTMGFWHFEPIIVMINGFALSGAAAYALVQAVQSLLAGGRQVDFGIVMTISAVNTAAAFGMARYVAAANRKLGSSLVAMDVHAWVMSASLSAAFLAAFVAGAILQHGTYARLAPYVDPVVLAVVCVLILPVPFKTVWRALTDIMLLAPDELKAHAETVARDAVEHHGFLDCRTYVARVGRARLIEMYFIVPPGLPPRPVEEWDRVRAAIGARIGGDTPDRWLTIVFTTDLSWAE